MMNNAHLSLEGTITSLYAPEIRFNGSSSSLVEKELRICGSIGGLPISIIHASGCTPNRNERILQLDSQTFSFILAWSDLVEESTPVSGARGLRALVAGLYPFDSQVIELQFSGVGFNLTTSLHIEIPHYLTRYYKGTKNLQHVFCESGRRAVSYMGGICEEGEMFCMHLHYKSLDAFRRIAGPALIMISVAFLDLTAVLAGGNDWRNNPGVIFGMLTINATAFGGLAAIRVGSTQRSFLNVIRLVAIIWVLALTLAIRTGGLPHLKVVVDGGLKACIVWLAMTAGFAFGVYPIVGDRARRGRIFALISIAGFVLWAASILLLDPLAVAKLFGANVQPPPVPG